MAGVSLRPYQQEAREAIWREWGEGRRRTLLVLPTGCHAKGERVLMADGSFKQAEDVVVGDRLMGPDGFGRTVLALHRGTDDLYRIVPVKGEPFAVNSGHVLSLVATNVSARPEYPCERMGGSIKDVTVKEWLCWPKYRKHVHKLYRSEMIERFDGNDGDGLPVDPYFLGVLLGDGHLSSGQISVTTMDSEVVEEVIKQAESFGMTVRTEPAGKATTYILNGGKNGRKRALRSKLEEAGVYGKKSGEKEVPFAYKTSPVNQRLSVIAGLIDTDGCHNGAGGYDYVSKSRALADDLAFMCRSVGLAAYVSECTKTAQGGFSGTYYRVSISGDCGIVPTRVPRRRARSRRQKKSVLRTGFDIVPAGRGEYFGFTVDGDNRYLLADFTVTHNCGKTICFAAVVKDAVDAGGRALVLAHRGELLEQAADKIKAATGLGCSVEKAESTSLGEWYRVTVGSVQTMMRPKRLGQFPEDWFDVIVVDEAHHALADSYQAVLGHFPGAKVLGVTATPDRADRRNMGEYFDSIAYEYSLPRAIKDGYLCPIKAQTIPLDIDISGVGVSAGDFKAGELGDALDPYLERIADEMLAAGCKERRTVVFLPLVKTSQRFRRVLAMRGFRAAEVNGESEDRAEVLAAFDRGEYDVLCNSMLLTEGWDCPSVDCVIVLRPTKSRSLYAQMVGRGTRLSPETGKTELLLLDFLWHTERHELCRPAHLVAKDDDVARAMTKAIEEDGGAVDIEDAEARAEKDVVAEREQRLADELAAMRKRKRKLVDPLQFEMSIQAEDLSGWYPTFAWEMEPASDKQLKALEKFGIFPDAVECAGKASLLLDRLGKRRGEGLTTPKQIRFLESKGFGHVGTWSFDAASRMISRISMNGWRVPKGVDPATYDPTGGDGAWKDTTS